MGTLTLGEKLRARRKQLHITQAALAGDAVTRILISRIESGAINPSLETLRYLAKRLDVPAGYFLSEEDDLMLFLRPTLKADLRRLYREGDYKGVLALCEEYALADDETNMLLCESAVRCGQEAYARGDMKDAAEWLDRALTYSEQTAYHTESILAEAMLCKALLSQADGGEMRESLDAYGSTLSQTMRMERYLLLRVMDGIENGEAQALKSLCTLLPEADPLCRTLINIWCEAELGSAAAALEALSAFLQGSEAEALEEDPLLLHRCVEKLESLSARTDDFKAAYQYASKRQQMERRYHIKHDADGND
ncbi:MAG: helix-turn-helix transcriptional regulator [Clostridia bacterium]|nr:helix-turn-helix transcriptional regulator [Clostridia bacterium]